jgi:hypothetical protein
MLAATSLIESIDMTFIENGQVVKKIHDNNIHNRRIEKLYIS